MVPAVQYARNGTVHLAYQTFGTGERDLVLIPGFISHADFPWEHPPYRRFMERLGSIARVTVYDKRGNGLSDPVDPTGGFDQHLDDLDTIIAAVGARQPVLFGWSEGAAVAVLYASHHPQQVQSLVLYGAFPRMIADEQYPHGVTREVFDAGLDLIRENWGTGISLTILGPEQFANEEFRQWWGRYERTASSPGVAMASLRIDAQLDLRDILPAIHVPTLLIHRVDDPIIRVQGSRLMAERMPDARLVELPGSLHWPWMGDSDAVVEEIEEFLTGRRRPAEADRALATVLFTDIVDSTERAAAAGDHRWRAIVEDHDAATRFELERHHGRLVKTTGDGALATFDRPAAAARCALALQRAVARQGLVLRAGLHTGEIELRAGDVTGLAVNLAARVSATAGAGQTLATRTVKDLVVGSGIQFEPAGTHDLRGVPGEWELYAVHDEA